MIKIQRLLYIINLFAKVIIALLYNIAEYIMHSHFQLDLHYRERGRISRARV